MMATVTTSFAEVEDDGVRASAWMTSFAEALDDGVRASAWMNHTVCGVHADGLDLASLRSRRIVFRCFLTCAAVRLASTHTIKASLSPSVSQHFGATVFLKIDLSVSTRSNCVFSSWPTVFLSLSREGHRVQRVNNTIPNASQHVDERARKFGRCLTRDKHRERNEMMVMASHLMKSCWYLVFVKQGSPTSVFRVLHCASRRRDSECPGGGN